jgi:ABC-type Fe3+-hydroxamate transport system substrate-binding protein
MFATAISLGAVACGAPALALPSVPSPGGAPRRIVVLNWSLTEMVLSLGVTPVGVPAPAWYTSSVVEPPLPAGIVDLGLLYQPNYDLLYELKPDLILITPAHSSVRASFERIAPTMTLGAYAMSPTPYEAMRLEFMTLARRLGREARGQSLLDETHGVLERARRALVLAAPATGYRGACG